MSMTTNTLTPAQVRSRIAKGKFRNHAMLSNLALSFFQTSQSYFARSIFPICPVDMSAGSYYVFELEDLLRDGWQKKPAYGKVMPTAIGEHTETYSVEVYQMIMGIDEIRETDVKRREGPAFANNSRQKQTRLIAEQANIHLDKAFANGFFNKDAWNDVRTGVDSTTPGDDQFIKFSNDNSDPVDYVAGLKLEMLEKTGREPNRMAMGPDVFRGLRKHPAILERVKYTGSTANPAKVTQKVLAELFEMEHISVMKSIQNKATQGKEADIGFIANRKDMLLAYAPDRPSIQEPSAGYILTWDMLGNGQTMPIFNYDGEGGTHSEYVEGLMSYAMHKTCDDLAIYLSDVV